MEAGFALLLASALLFVLPAGLTLRWLRRRRQPDIGRTPGAHSLGACRRAAGRIDRLANRFPNPPRCLARALAAWMLLARRGIGAEIRFGVAREDGALRAHAWLLAGETILLGGDRAADFVPIGGVGQIQLQTTVRDRRAGQATTGGRPN